MNARTYGEERSDAVDENEVLPRIRLVGQCGGQYPIQDYDPLAPGADIGIDVTLTKETRRPKREGFVRVERFLAVLHLGYGVVKV